jgi:hypothetical protein
VHHSERLGRRSLMLPYGKPTREACFIRHVPLLEAISRTRSGSPRPDLRWLPLHCSALIYASDTVRDNGRTTWHNAGYEQEFNTAWV